MVHIIQAGGVGARIPTSEKKPKIKPGKGGSGGTGGLRVAGGTIAGPTVTGTQEITVGFQPKLILLFGAGGVLDGTDANGFRTLFGAADSTSRQFCNSASVQDNVTSNAAQRIANVIFSLTDWTSGNAPVLVASLQTVGSNSFTLNWTTVTGSAFYVFWLAFGGNNFQGYVKQWDAAASTGNQNVTGVPFEPTCVIHSFSESGAAINTTRQDGMIGIGAMSAAQQWAVSIAQDDAGAIPDAARIFKTDQSMHQVTSTTGIDYRAARTSLNADGFTVNFGNAPAAVTSMFSVCMRGANFAVGTTTKPTGAAPATHNVTGLTFKPKALLMAGHCQVAQGGDVGITYSNLSVGFAISSGLRRSVSVEGLDSGIVEACQAARYLSTNHILNGVIATNGGLFISGGFSQFNNDGFTLTWNPNDAVAAVFGYVAIG